MRRLLMVHHRIVLAKAGPLWSPSVALGARRPLHRHRPVVMGPGASLGRDDSYLFLFTGLRFSMKAAMPSARSSRAKVEWNRLRSTFMPSDSVVSKARLTASLAIAAA